MVNQGVKEDDSELSKAFVHVSAQALNADNAETLGASLLNSPACWPRSPAVLLYAELLVAAL